MSNRERTLKFYEIYRTKLAPMLGKYETIRKQELEGVVILASIALSVLIVCAVIIMLTGHSSAGNSSQMWLAVIFTLSLLGAVCCFYFSNERYKEFKIKLKTLCLPYLLKLFGDIKWLNNQMVISNAKLDKSGLFGMYSDRRVDDEFVGEFNGVPFKISETEVWYESGSGKYKIGCPVFKGVVISFKLNKTIKNRTIVATKGDLIKRNSYWVLYILLIMVMFSILIGCVQFIALDPVGSIVAIAIVLALLFVICYASMGSKGKPLNEVTLEDPRFCKKFNAYSSDQVEARYLLTTAFIERFQNLNTAFGAKKAKCSFFDDEIMFAISMDDNLFEIGALYKSLTDPSAIQKFYNELSSIYDMIDYFKLDEKTGL